MGLPTVAVLEEETGARDGSNSAAAMSGQTKDSADQGGDPATEEQKARKALECPCLDDLRGGPCGEEFSKAFLCFVKSREPEKGSDCVGPFEKMQRCIMENANQFRSPTHPQTDTGNPDQGQIPSTEEDEDESEDEDEDDDDDDDDEDYSTHGLVPAPPPISDISIKLPPWYPKQNSDDERTK